MKVFNHYDTDIVLAYEEGDRGPILQFYEYVGGEITEPYATLSVNVNYYRPFNYLEFPIKNYSENEGLLDLVLAADLGEVIGDVASGFVRIQIVQFNEEKLKEALFNPEALETKIELER